MDYTQAVILSVIEGLTEFLPVSSTGHLVLTSNLLGIKQSEFVKSFEIIIQFGAILSVVFIYWKRLISSFSVLNKIFIAFIPTAILGLVFYKIIKTLLLGNVLVTVFALIIGGFIIIILEKKLKSHETTTIETLNIKQLLIIGLIQSVSMIPGVSRSAASIIGGKIIGLSRNNATEFSFFLAIPTIFAATSLDLIKSEFNFDQNQLVLLAIGFLGSFITSIIAIKFFIKFVQTNSLIPFGIYRIFLGLVYLLFFL